MKSEQKNGRTSEPRTLPVGNGKDLDRVRSSVPEIVQIREQSLEAESQIGEIAQQNTAAFAAFLQNVITSTKRGDFRVQIEEEIRCIERP